MTKNNAIQMVPGAAKEGQNPFGYQTPCSLATTRSRALRALRARQCCLLATSTDPWGYPPARNSSQADCHRSSTSGGRNVAHSPFSKSSDPTTALPTDSGT